MHSTTVELKQEALAREDKRTLDDFLIVEVEEITSRLK
jgi:hypothetical protein